MVDDVSFIVMLLVATKDGCVGHQGNVEMKQRELGKSMDREVACIENQEEKEKEKEKEREEK